MTKESFYRIDKPVYVYRNLTKKCYSVMQRGKVIDRPTDLVLINCKFIVRPEGREKVLRTGQKNVHAFVKGYLVRECHSQSAKIRYNPYEADYFQCGGSPIFEADVVLFNSDGVYLGEKSEN